MHAGNCGTSRGRKLLVVRAARGSSATVQKPNPVPQPAAYQQTLRRSFTLGGIGLHTGDQSLVRVLPAFAGEGRYFVRVPPGTNSDMWEVEQPQSRKLEDIGPSTRRSAGGAGGMNSALFFQFLEKCEDGDFDGSFAEYLQQLGPGLRTDTLFIDAETALLPEEEPTPGQPSEQRLQALAGNLQQGHRWCSVLGQGERAIWGVEHLLAALESCGVDNARIEIEGGRELPIVDGSAFGWAAQVQRAGLRPAPSASGSDAPVSKSIHSLQQEVTQRDGEGFITFYPGTSARVTVGVDCAEAPAIGRQWFTWSPEEAGHEHFRYALSPARTWFTSPDAVRALLKEGLLQGGPDYVSIIADGEDWLDPTMVRFPFDEAARHAVVDLLGDLSLLASPGGRGLPAGHIVAYRPTHELQAQFVRELQTTIDNLG